MKQITGGQKLFIVTGLILSVMLILPGIALAADPACIDAAGTPIGCVKLAATPPELVGDVYINGVLQTAALPLNSAIIFFDAANTGVPQLIEIKNMTDGSEAMVTGKLYTYADFSKTVTPTPGPRPEIKVAPKKVYVNGLLEVTCDAKKYVAENVTCSVTLDGTVDPDPLAPGAHFTYYVAPGVHQVDVSLTGTDAWLWPTPFSKSVTTKASGTPTKLKASFDKLAHVTIKFSQSDMLGEFQVDGISLNSLSPEGYTNSSNSVDGWFTPNTPHKIVIPWIYNSQSYTFGTCYSVKDQTFTVPPGAEKTITLTVKKSGCWIVPVTITVPANTLSAGEHVVNALDSCPDGTTYPYTIAFFTVSNSAPIVPGNVYLFWEGLTKKLPGLDKSSNYLTSINPAQTLVIIEPRNFGTTKPTYPINWYCSTSFNIDGGPAQIPVTGDLYQTKPQ